MAHIDVMQKHMLFDRLEAPLVRFERFWRVNGARSRIIRGAQARQQRPEDALGDEVTHRRILAGDDRKTKGAVPELG